MASSVPSYVNFQSMGTSSHLTRYADGSFLTVWTSFDRSGAAYVYGKAFKADGTVLRDTFLIDSAPAAAAASYSKITATTLSDGRTVIARRLSLPRESGSVTFGEPSDDHLVKAC